MECFFLAHFSRCRDIELVLQPSLSDVATLSSCQDILHAMSRHCSSDVATLLPLLFLLLFAVFFFFKFMQNISLSEDSIILHYIGLLSMKYE